MSAKYFGLKPMLWNLNLVLNKRALCGFICVLLFFSKLSGQISVKYFLLWYSCLNAPSFGNIFK